MWCVPARGPADPRLAGPGPSAQCSASLASHCDGGCGDQRLPPAFECGAHPSSAAVVPKQTQYPEPCSEGCLLRCDGVGHGSYASPAVLRTTSPYLLARNPSAGGAPARTPLRPSPCSCFPYPCPCPRMHAKRPPLKSRMAAAATSLLPQSRPAKHASAAVGASVRGAGVGVGRRPPSHWSRRSRLGGEQSGRCGPLTCSTHPGYLATCRYKTCA